MIEYLETIFLDNPIKKYIYFGIIFLFFWISKKWITKSIAFYIYKIFNLSKFVVSKIIFLKWIIKPIEKFILTVFLYLCIKSFTYPHILDFYLFNTLFSTLIESICKGIFIVIFIWFLLRLIDLIVVIIEQQESHKKYSDEHLITFFKDIIKFVLIIMGILLILKIVFNQNIGAILTSLSLVGAAVALATRESLENLIASLIILIDKPFSNGDTVKINDYKGTVEKIGMRSTRIRTFEKVYISVPNKLMVDTIINNISLSTSRRTENTLYLDQSNNIENVLEFILKIHDLFIQDRIMDKNVYLKEIAKESYNIYFYYFTDFKEEEKYYCNFVQTMNIEIIKIATQLSIQWYKPPNQN